MNTGYICVWTQTTSVYELNSNLSHIFPKIEIVNNFFFFVYASVTLLLFFIMLV